MAAASQVALDRAIDRLLAPASQPTQRPKAIFRVVPATAVGFDFTRTLIGAAPSDGEALERHGPFETERAAHALAKRAAARLSAERPNFVVGVIGLADEVRPSLPASARFRAEGVSAGGVVEQPKCEVCGKPTRYNNGRAVRFCPRKPGEKRSACNTRHSTIVFKAKINSSADLRRERNKRERVRRRNSPQIWAKHLERNRALKAKQKAAKEPPAADITAEPPKCVTCGKPTRFLNGRPQLYCPRVDGRSRCCEAAKEKRLKNDPEKMAARQARVRARYQRIVATPEGRAQMQRKWRKRQRGHGGEAQPTGSVLVTASPRGEGYELFSRIHAAVPSNMPPSLRMDIIGEAAVLVLEGSDLPAAVASATKSVRRDGNRLRYAKPIDDCFWLADETQSALEHYL